MTVTAIVDRNENGEIKPNVDKNIFVIVLLTVSLMLLPLCLINDMRKFKVAIFFHTSRSSDTLF